MYTFIDVNEVSEKAILPSEALQINGDFIEVLVPGYRTLTVSGRELLSPELTSYETGSRDGATLKQKRIPARIITVKYQLIAKSNEEFREAYNKLADILNVEEAELIFNDEQDKFYKGTPSNFSTVEAGTNSVIGEFELYCADPFKYSVVEYEAEPGANGFLINYGGTYKSYPTLEAEFYNENESAAALTGNGDCGYVAFFNEREKIIQLGDPDETDTEEYPKSQTLVNQKFNTETSWGTIAETNWAINKSVSAFEQVGSVAMTVASHDVTKAPSTSGELLKITSKVKKPYVNYKVTAETSGRTAESINVKVNISTTVDVVTNSGTATPKSGASVKLSKVALYASSTASKKSNTITGTYYLWDGDVIKNRIRITNAKSRVGKSGQVTGWVNVSDLGLTTKTTSGLGKGYGLKGCICFNGGDWHYATIKSESSNWDDNQSHTVSITVKVDGIEADTDVIEDIKFKVERTDDKDSNTGLLDETQCKDLEISSYTAPVAATYYLMPQTYGTGSKWHGPSITRTIPADAAGDIGASNFSFSWRQKMAIGNSATATHELGTFQTMLVSGSGSNRRIVAAVTITKKATGKKAVLYFYVNSILVHQQEIDLSFNNKYFGNNKSGLTTVKTSSIEKTGEKVTFNIGGIVKTFKDKNIKNTAVNEISFTMTKYGTKPELSFNGLYWAKFIKNNCDTYEDIPNKFSSNDVVTADCKSGEVFLNNSPTPALGAHGNDWEEFYLKPGLNQIGYSYSSWVESIYAPTFRIKYREVFL